jgi:N-carbamoyl-L-amino-acid hydrolase
MVNIDGERLLESLRTLRTFGATGAGVVRPTFSDIDMEARRWLVAQLESAGLTASIDAVGTVFGRSPNPGPALILGSHCDTQPEGGWLDGAMGVMYALEVARTLLDDPATSHLAVDVAAWSDEEGTYSSCLGSHSFVGELTADDLTSANDDGETVAEAIARVGLSNAPTVRLDPDRHVGYLEAHIEQGPHLEDRELLVGVVTSIVGIRAIEVSFTGEQNHAGSTPMPRRKDAGVSLFEFGVRLREQLSELAGPTTVWTIGDARLHPGTESIIPGSAWCVIQFRDPSDTVLDAFQGAITDLAAQMTDEGPVAVDASLRREAMAPADMDPKFRRHLCEASEATTPGNWVEMPSAAIHDATVLSKHLPCAMLFIPSIGGVSHDFSEDSHDADIVTGCQVLAKATASILSS